MLLDARYHRVDTENGVGETTDVGVKLLISKEEEVALYILSSRAIDC